MDIETVKSLFVWIMIIAICGVLMTFSFYIILFALPLMLLIAIILLPFNIYNNFQAKRNYHRKQKQNKSGEVIDVDCEVIKSEKNN